MLSMIRARAKSCRTCHSRQVNELLYEIGKLTKRRARRDRTSSRRPSQYLRARIRAIPYGNCIMGRVRRARVMMKPLPWQVARLHRRPTSCPSCPAPELGSLPPSCIVSRRLAGFIVCRSLTSVAACPAGGIASPSAALIGSIWAAVAAASSSSLPQLHRARHNVQPFGSTVSRLRRCGEMLGIKRESLTNSLKNISANLWRHFAHIAQLVGIAQLFATSSAVPLLRVAAWQHYIAAASIRLPSCWILPPCCHAMGPPIFRRQTSGTNNAPARVGPLENFFLQNLPP